uniref:MINDY deubiquitinase domain-containing protein n=1 Tax=Brassica campestris TaxID=3711 RepID=A0A3P5ZT28_BRACM|nr:unnamed protein product [Brassica rapa]
MATRTNQETRTNQADQATRNGEVTYQIKAINYGGENKMIILPNENGSSPLIAICTRNLLILRNGMDLTPDRCEVTQQRLIDLLAFRLFMIEDDKEDHFENKAQNIMDAMELLPRLAAGIDVNVKFRSIDDFELSPELTIFGLLKIPLYHGWIFDPQDNETATAVGFKSYNDLMMAGLVTLAEKSPIGQGCGESSVDFTATPTRTPTSAEHSRLGREEIVKNTMPICEPCDYLLSIIVIGIVLAVAETRKTQAVGEHPRLDTQWILWTLDLAVLAPLAKVI